MNYKVIIGDVTNPPYLNLDHHTLLLQIVNDENRMLSGVAKVIYTKWPIVKQRYHDLFKNYGDCLYHRYIPTYPAKLGRNQYIKVDLGLSVVNMIAQSDCGGYEGLAPIRYESLRECLIRIKNDIESVPTTKFDIIAPLFGCHLAGGHFHEVFDIVHDVFKDLELDWTWYVLTNEEKEEVEQKILSSS